MSKCKSQQTNLKSVPKFIINNTINSFLNCQRFDNLKTITVSECCLIKLLPCILFEKYITILALEMASPGNQHCAICIGTLSSPTEVLQSVDMRILRRDIRSNRDRQTHTGWFQYFAHILERSEKLPSVILPSPEGGIQNVSGIRNDSRTLGTISAYT